MKSSVIRIAKKEIQISLRQKLVMVLSIVIMVLLGVALYTSYILFKQQQDIVKTAQQETRKDWLEQGDKHPHIAAHYGMYVFKPKTLLSLFDFGLDTYTGTSVYIEAHHQHEFMFRPAQDYNTMIRFGELSVALVFQVLIPLLIIFLSFSAFTDERENGTLKLLISQGVSYSTIIKGKIAGYTSIILGIIIPFLIFVSVLYVVIPIDTSNVSDFGLRILLLIIIYSGYLLIFIAFSIWVSIQSSTGKNALLTLLTCWVLFVIIIPKTVAGFGKHLYPSPSMKVFKENIKNDIEKGIDRKDSKIDRMQKLEKAYLQYYNVDSLHKLPINYGGVMMQANEDYASRVYDIHWKKLIDTFNKQNYISSISSFISPYLAIRNLSMGLSATDLHTSNHFQKVTENYRRDLIRKMNNDMAQNSKYGEFYEYKANKDLWSSIKDFDYKTLSVVKVLKFYKIELIALACWGITIFFLLYYSSTKMKPIL